MKKITVALVDNHCLFRRGIASLIETFENYEVLFDAGGGEEFCRKVSSKFKPDMVLPDLNMPIFDGGQKLYGSSKTIQILKALDTVAAMDVYLPSFVTNYLAKGFSKPSWSCMQSEISSLNLDQRL